MGGQTVDFSEISFFELDRLFAASARALRRKLRRRRDEGAAESSPSRSRSPVRKLFGRVSRLPSFGGFTSAVDKIERTVVAATIPAGTDEKMLYDFFSHCGTVTDIKILRNRLQMPTGIVVVEFTGDDDVQKACSLQPPQNELMGTPIQVKILESQQPSKNSQPKRPMTRQQFTYHVLTGMKTGGVDGPTMRKLHIKNLRPVVTEDDMRGIFKPFGEFENFEMGSQECWITFKGAGDAQDAMTSMQGFQLVGQELVIILQSVTFEKPVVPSPPPPEKMDLAADTDFGATGIETNAANNRIELMQKLLNSHSQQGVPTVVGLTAPGAAVRPTTMQVNMPPAPKPGTPSSRTLLLQNMFQPGTVDLEKDPRFYEEIREDTHDECTKFGKVLHVTVDPRGSTGLIYIYFEGSAQRLAAEMALNGRWFEGKKIVAMGIDDSIWQALAAQAQTGITQS